MCFVVEHFSYCNFPFEEVSVFASLIFNVGKVGTQQHFWQHLAANLSNEDQYYKCCDTRHLKNTIQGSLHVNGVTLK